LDGLGVLDESLVLHALTDPHPGVRENALLLAQKFAAHGGTDQGLTTRNELTKRVLALADDPSARVRFQTALTLGEFDSPQTRDALMKIVKRDCRYEWSRLAVLSSLRDGAAEFFVRFIDDAEFRQASDDHKTSLMHELADLIGARASVETNGPARLLTALSVGGVPGDWPTAAIEGLQTGLARLATSVKADPAAQAALEKLEAADSPRLLAAVWQTRRALGLPPSPKLRQSLAQAVGNAQDNSSAAGQRVESLRLLALGESAEVKAALLAVLQGTQPAAVQAAAIETLRGLNEPEIAMALVDRWRALSPGVRAPVIDLLLRRRGYHDALLLAVEQGKIKVGELNLDLEQRRRLLRDSSAETKTRAAKFWGDEEYSNRKSLVTDWLAKLPASGDAARGTTVFEKICITCHRAGVVGNAVGPDLSEMAHRSVEDLLSNILDPNMAINPAYIAFTAEWSPDESATGILQSETPDAVTLLQAQGVKIVIPRAKLKRLESSGLSLMPEGLEAGMTPQELRDLIAFLQQPK
jgi:putative heme-binding domain-containing protein